MNYYNSIKQELINNEIYKKVKDYSKNKSDLSTYYNVGKILSEAGKHYGEGIIKDYSIRLTKELGKKFDERTLRRFRQFYILYMSKNWSTVSTNLTWSHYTELLSIKDINKINYYIKISVEQNLSVRELRSKVKSNDYERLDDYTKIKLMNNEENKISDFIKNPILIKNSYNYKDISEKVLKGLILEDLPSFLKELDNGFTFINAFTKKYGIIQYMIDNDKVDLFKCGDLIDIEYIDTVNKKEMPIKKITNIFDIVSCENFQSYKNIQNSTDNQRIKNFVDARNGGQTIQLLKYKKEVISKIKNILDSLDYFDASGLINIVEKFFNGSKINSAIIQDRSKNSPKYLRVTLENQLKQLTATILQSSYAIDKVFRNMGEDNSHINEFLMLELVSMSNDLDDLINFIKKIDYLSKEIADKYNVIVCDKELEIIDYNDIKNINSNYDDLRKNFKNTLVINYPCNSPFIKKDISDNLRKEVRWYINGHWISHFYNDENKVKNIKELLKIQMEENAIEDVDPLKYFEWGLPKTTSLGLSIDRWLQMLCDIKNINSISNPIELDYAKKLVRR